MDEKKDGVTREEMKAYIHAILKKPIAAKKLLDDIAFILEDFYIGKFEIIGEEIRAELYSGQTFIISIREESN